MEIELKSVSCPIDISETIDKYMENILKYFSWIKSVKQYMVMCKVYNHHAINKECI